MKIRLWRAYAPLLAVTLAYHLAAVLALADTRLQISLDLVELFANTKIVAVLLLLTLPVYGYVALVMTHDGERPVTRILSWARRTPFFEIGFFRLLPMIAILTLNQADYLAFKRAIPDLQPYAWDAAFARLDRWLFLGTDPWRLTHALLSSPGASSALSLAYAVWFYVVFLAFAAASLRRLESRLRMTFLLAFLLAWAVAGSGLAVLFSSAGPVYAERLFGDATFVELMQRLAEQNEDAPIYALFAQKLLWQGYADPEFPAMGISAFPSMHLCMAALVMLFGFGCSRIVGWGLAAFCGVMLVGSVHLGWHYAVDGLAGIALALVFWRGARRFTDWWFERAA